MGLFSNVTKYKNQDYQSLRKHAQEANKLFVDTEFPPENKTLYYAKESAGKFAGVEWKRPKDIHSDPHLFVEGASAHDLIQGEMGNCWLVASCSCLASHADVWSKIIPDHKDQEWDSKHPERYAGIFRFRFCRFNEWIEVVIDDLLPTRNGKLIFCHSKDRNEFWSALLEKAYAKFFGSYEALDGGELAEGLEDFTGGVSEPIDMKAENYATDATKRDEFFNNLVKCWSRKALIAAAIPVNPDGNDMEAMLPSGLVVGHAYGVTAVKQVPLEGTGFLGLFNQTKLDMIRLRNPWGGTEWNGPFSDGSAEWEKISKSDRSRLGLTFEDDGEFWMQFNDFCTHFPTLCICRVVNTSIFSLEKTWNESVLHSEWHDKQRNGGCLNNQDTFLQNPQFVFDVKSKEDDCLMALTQKSSRGDTTDIKLIIGFTILRVEVNREYRVHQVDQSIKSSDFRNSRSIFLKQRLKQGRYVVVLCTFEKGLSADFLFRLYTDEANHGRELVKDIPVKSFGQNLCCCFPCCRFPIMATRIKVMRAVNLEKKGSSGKADPYVYAVCERTSVRSETVSNTLSPEWNFAAIFYRHNPRQNPIKIQIYNDNMIRDDCMGEATISVYEEIKDKPMELELFDHKDSGTRRPGKVWVVISSSSDFMKI